MEPNNFADKLRFLRQDRGITIRELEEGAGIGHSTIVRWEKGLTVPRSQEMIKPLADFFHVPLSFFIDDAKQIERLITDTSVIRNILERLDALESNAHNGHL